MSVYSVVVTCLLGLPLMYILKVTLQIEGLEIKLHCYMLWKLATILHHAMINAITGKDLFLMNDNFILGSSE